MLCNTHFSINLIHEKLMLYILLLHLMLINDNIIKLKYNT